MKRKGSLQHKLLQTLIIALVFGLVAGGAFFGITYLIGRLSGQNTGVGTSSVRIKGTSVSESAVVSDVSEVVNDVLPAIVSVTNVSLNEYRAMNTSQNMPNTGTGVIYSQDSSNLYIITNSHVITTEDALTTFSDGAAAPASLVGRSVSADIAVISVKLSDIDDNTMNSIKVGVIGDSEKLLLGDGAIIIGNSLGSGKSVSTGVISALDRQVLTTDEQGRAVVNYLIQTDATINRSNTGGPIVNMQGRVVGITSDQFDEDGIEEMGYAIPSSSLISVVNSILSPSSSVVNNNNNNGQTPYFGIAAMDISQATASQYSLPIGVYVAQVYPGSNAEKSGLHKGDIITSFDGIKVSSMSQIQNIISKHNVGDKVQMEVAYAENNYNMEIVETVLEQSNQ